MLGFFFELIYTTYILIQWSGISFLLLLFNTFFISFIIDKTYILSIILSGILMGLYISQGIFSRIKNRKLFKSVSNDNHYE